MRDDIGARCEAIEQCYEFMLAYAGQGLSGDEGRRASGEVRDYLSRAIEALSGLAGAYTAAVEQLNLQPAEPYHVFLAVLDRDARDALAAIQVVFSQTNISSQLVDNLNASIHVRALLTDLFLIDEILKPQRIQDKSVASSQVETEKLT